MENCPSCKSKDTTINRLKGRLRKFGTLYREIQLHRVMYEGWDKQLDALIAEGARAESLDELKKSKGPRREMKTLVGLALAMLGIGTAVASEIDSQLNKIISQFASVKVATGQPAVVAVFPFQTEEKLAQRKVDVAVSELLTIRLVQNSKFKLVERSQLETVLKEQHLGMSGAVESGTAAKIGQLVGARFVVLGNVIRLGRSYQISAKLVDSQSSEIVSAQIVEVPVRVFDAEASRYLVLVPDNQIIGLYLSGGYGSFGTITSSPQTVNGVTGNITGVSAKASEVGVGIRYFPAHWLMLDGAYMPIYSNGKMHYSSIGQGPNFDSTLNGWALALSANWIYPLAESVKFLTGLGAGTYRVAWNWGGYGSNQTLSQSSFFRPFIRAGGEWRPQARFGIGIIENLFLTDSTMKIYSANSSGAGGSTPSDPILTIKMPRFSTQGTLSVYF